MFKRLIFISLIFGAQSAHSAITSTYSGKVEGVRVEGSTGLISMSSYIENGDPRCNRVWVDLLKDEDKAAYSTILMAFASDKTVHIRAVSGSTNKRYSACELYDIFVPRQ